jgi:hypothetical protein
MFAFKKMDNNKVMRRSRALQNYKYRDLKERICDSKIDYKLTSRRLAHFLLQYLYPKVY